MAASLADFRSFVAYFRLCVDLDFFLNAELAWFGSTNYFPFHVRCWALLPYKGRQQASFGNIMDWRQLPGSIATSPNRPEWKWVQAHPHVQQARHWRINQPQGQRKRNKTAHHLVQPTIFDACVVAGPSSRGVQRMTTTAPLEACKVRGFKI